MQPQQQHSHKRKHEHQGQHRRKHQQTKRKEKQDLRLEWPQDECQQPRHKRDRASSRDDELANTKSRESSKRKKGIVAFVVGKKTDSTRRAFGDNGDGHAAITSNCDNSDNDNDDDGDDNMEDGKEDYTHANGVFLGDSYASTKTAKADLENRTRVYKINKTTSHIGASTNDYNNNNNNASAVERDNDTNTNTNTDAPQNISAKRQRRSRASATATLETAAQAKRPLTPTKRVDDLDSRIESEHVHPDYDENINGNDHKDHGSNGNEENGSVNNDDNDGVDIDHGSDRGRSNNKPKNKKKTQATNTKTKTNKRRKVVSVKNVKPKHGADIVTDASAPARTALNTNDGFEGDVDTNLNARADFGSNHISSSSSSSSPIRSFAMADYAADHYADETAALWTTIRDTIGAPTINGTLDSTAAGLHFENGNAHADVSSENAIPDESDDTNDIFNSEIARLVANALRVATKSVKRNSESEREGEIDINRSDAAVVGTQKEDIHSKYDNAYRVDDDKNTGIIITTKNAVSADSLPRFLDDECCASWLLRPGSHRYRRWYDSAGAPEATSPDIERVARAMTYAKMARLTDSLMKNPSFVSRHHLETWDWFVRVQLPAIIRETPRFEVESQVSQRRCVVEIGDVHLRWPSIKESDGIVRTVLWTECVIRGLTYAINVEIDVSVTYYDAATKKQTSRHDYKEVHVGSIPVPVRGTGCTQQRGAGPAGGGSVCDTDPLDPGGFFVVGGNEKVIITQERMKTNRALVFRERQPSKWSYRCEVRSCLEQRVRSTSTLILLVGGLAAGKQPEIRVRLPFIRKFELPLVWMFSLLGVSDKQGVRDAVLAWTARDPRTGKGADPPLEALLDRILEAHDDFPKRWTRDDMLNEVGRRDKEGAPTREKRIRDVEHVLRSEFLPHIGHDPSARVAYVGHCVHELLLRALERLPPHDKDHYASKGVDSLGTLFALLLRPNWRATFANAKKEAKRALDRGALVDPDSCFRDLRITSSFKYALSTGRWGTKKGASPHTGFAQVHTRVNPTAMLSSLRKFSVYVNKDGRLSAPRQLDPSALGITCPYETPDGSHCGTSKNLALGARVTVGHDSRLWIEALREAGAVEAGWLPLNYPTPTESVPWKEVFVGTEIEREMTLGPPLGSSGELDVGTEVELKGAASAATSTIVTATATAARGREDNSNNIAINGTSNSRGAGAGAGIGTRTNTATATATGHGRNPVSVTVPVPVGSIASSAPQVQRKAIGLTPSRLRSAMTTVFVHGSPWGFVRTDKASEVVERLRRMRRGAGLVPQTAAIWHTPAERRIDLSAEPGSMVRPLIPLACAPEFVEFLNGPEAGSWRALERRGLVEWIGKEEERTLRVATRPAALLAGFDGVQRAKQKLSRSQGTTKDIRSNSEKNHGSGCSDADKAGADPSADADVGSSTDGSGNDATVSDDGDGDNDHLDESIPPGYDAEAVEEARAVDRQPFTHLEVDPMLLLGVCSSKIPFANFNQSPRNAYGATMAKQSQSTPYASTRLDSAQSYELMYPQRPLVQTRSERTLFHSQPSGSNVMLAIACFDGYNVEDALIVSEAAVQRGLFVNVSRHTYREEERVRAADAARIERPPPRSTRGLRDANYATLGPRGYAEPGTELNPGDVIIGKTAAAEEIVAKGKRKRPPRAGSPAAAAAAAAAARAVAAGVAGAPAPLPVPLAPVTEGDLTTKVQTVSVPRDASLVMRSNSEPCVVDSVIETTNRDGARIVKLVGSSFRMAQVGDKLCSRHAQKGEIGYLVKEADMPWIPVGRNAGSRPDIIMNAHGIPSRMTGGHIMETYAAKAATASGRFIDGTSWGEQSMDEFVRALRDSGMRPDGTELFSHPHTGELMECPVFYGPNAYDCLKHVGFEKMHGRAVGPVQILIHQPVEGRNNTGGLRFGNMECETLVSHGASALLYDRMAAHSDPYLSHVCGKCGLLAISGTPSMPAHCRVCRSVDDIHVIRIPYAAQLMVKELASAMLALRFDIEAANIPEPPSFLSAPPLPPSSPSKRLKRSVPDNDGSKDDNNNNKNKKVRTNASTRYVSSTIRTSFRDDGNAHTMRQSSQSDDFFAHIEKELAAQATSDGYNRDDDQDNLCHDDERRPRDATDVNKGEPSVKEQVDILYDIRFSHLQQRLDERNNDGSSNSSNRSNNTNNITDNRFNKVIGRVEPYVPEFISLDRSSGTADVVSVVINNDDDDELPWWKHFA